MRRKSLKPNKALLFTFEPHASDPWVIFQVRSDSPVTTYLVDDMGMEDFREGKAPESYAGYRDRRFHQADLPLPNYDRFHLIVSNKLDQAAKIEYDLKYR
jgi:hypothetical protein